MTDRVARRPHGRKAREVYGADDVHSFAWEPVLAALALGPGDRLLDVGCGGGVFLRRALETGCDAVGLDHSPEMVALARARRPARTIVEGRAEETARFADGEFTAVSCLVAFFFMDDPVRVLREMRRVLDPAQRPDRDLHDAARGEGHARRPVPARHSRPLLHRRGTGGAAARRRVRRVAGDANRDRRPASRRTVGSSGGRGRARPGLGRPLRLHDGRAPLRARARLRTRRRVRC